MQNIKKWYVDFLEKEHRTFFGFLFEYFLKFLSLFYGIAVEIRNLCYDSGMAPVVSCTRPIISVGNLSWAGSGKTTMAFYLYQKLSPSKRVAVLRRGYGADEGKMLTELTPHVFSLPDRARLATSHARSFDLFILDDGFQYRRLQRKLDIVIMGAREFKKQYWLLPAYIFREPLESLRRADILILNYKDELSEPYLLKRKLAARFPLLKIYFAKYICKSFTDFSGNEVSLDYLKTRNLAALAGIGYPQGFLKKLRDAGLNIKKELIYPDHYELTASEFFGLQVDLKDQGIEDIIITHKDKYHLPKCEIKLNVYILNIAMEIEDENDFLENVKKRLA